MAWLRPVRRWTRPNCCVASAVAPRHGGSWNRWNLWRQALGEAGAMLGDLWKSNCQAMMVVMTMTMMMMTTTTTMMMTTTMTMMMMTMTMTMMMMMMMTMTFVICWILDTWGILFSDPFRGDPCGLRIRREGPTGPTATAAWKLTTTTQTKDSEQSRIEIRNCV